MTLKIVDLPTYYMYTILCDNFDHIKLLMNIFNCYPPPLKFLQGQQIAANNLA